MSLLLWAADGDTADANKNHTVTMRMHDGGSFAISVGTYPVKIKIDPAEGKTIGSIMLGDTDITTLLDANGCITLNDPDNAGTAVSADTTITVTYSESTQL